MSRSKTLLNDAIDTLIESMRILNEDDRQKTVENNDLTEMFMSIKKELTDKTIDENDHLRKILGGHYDRQD